LVRQLALRILLNGAHGGCADRRLADQPVHLAQYHGICGAASWRRRAADESHVTHVCSPVLADAAEGAPKRGEDQTT